MRRLSRGGTYLRVADPRWIDPLELGPSRVHGGRWNSPGSFGALYLCADRVVARANVDRLLADEPYGPEDLDPEAAPVLVEVRVAEADRLDVVSDAGCEAAGLPRGYPLDADGLLIDHHVCQPIGVAARRAGLAGVASRSAVAPGEELAHFPRVGSEQPELGETRAFNGWFWTR